MNIVLLFSYYYENNIILFVSLEVHAFERGFHDKGFTFFKKGITKRGIHVNPLNHPGYGREALKSNFQAMHFPRF